MTLLIWLSKTPECGTRRQYYLSLWWDFLASQPDLNYHNPRVWEEVLSIARYWLERGVTGFRLDTVNFYYHDQALRSNPPTDDRSTSLAEESNPYSYQDHVYDKNRPEVVEFPHGAWCIDERVSRFIDPWRDRRGSTSLLAINRRVHKGGAT